MNCKHCKKEIKEAIPCVRYQKSEWKGAGAFAGSPEYIEEIPVDAGVFCSDTCLITYLGNQFSSKY